MHGTKAGLFTLTMNQLFELLDILLESSSPARICSFQGSGAVQDIAEVNPE